MRELLFLAHRIPYPPNKGDKIRSYHMLEYLARHYRVHLGAFIDDPEDWRYADHVRQMCAQTCLIALDPRRARLRSLSGILTGEALTLPYYRHRGLRQWVERLLAGRRIERIFVFSSALAQYVDDPNLGVRRVLDFVDVDSEKWRQYAAKHRWPLSWVYRREARKLFDAERRWANLFDTSLFVTQAETDLFRRQAPEVESRTVAIENGVDTEYFSPKRDYPSPYPPQERVLAFVGAMDYWANVDAAKWFAEEVFPGVRARVAEARFYVVGARPTKEALRLNDLPGVRVTGSVPDVRPYLAHARAAVAPLRIARGIQNKVLEAMAMARPIMATTPAMDGLRGWDALRALVSDDPAYLAQTGARLLLGEDDAPYGDWGRACVAKHYSWEANLRGVGDVLEGAAGRAAVAAS